MGDSREVGQLHPFGVDKHEAHVLRRVVHEQAADYRVDANALAAAGGARNEQMRHLGEVGRDRLPRYPLAQGEAQVGTAGHSIEGGALDDAAHRHQRCAVVRYLNAYDRPAGHRRLDADGRRRQGQRQIVGQGGDAVHPYPGPGYDLGTVLGLAVFVVNRLALFVSGDDGTCLRLPSRLDAKLGDGGTLTDADHASVDAERGKRVNDELGARLVVNWSQLLLTGLRQEVDGRQLPAAARGAPHRQGALVGGWLLLRGRGDDNRILVLLAGCRRWLLLLLLHLGFGFGDGWGCGLGLFNRLRRFGPLLIQRRDVGISFGIALLFVGALRKERREERPQRLPSALG